MVLAATNRPADLDEAVLRRFAVQCEVPLPDAVCREAILRLTLARHVGEAGADAVERVLRDVRVTHVRVSPNRTLVRFSFTSKQLDERGLTGTVRA